jgi:hypothetical protein
MTCFLLEEWLSENQVIVEPIKLFDPSPDQHPKGRAASDHLERDATRSLDMAPRVAETINYLLAPWR